MYCRADGCTSSTRTALKLHHQSSCLSSSFPLSVSRRRRVLTAGDKLLRHTSISSFVTPARREFSSCRRAVVNTFVPTQSIVLTSLLSCHLQSPCFCCSSCCYCSFLDPESGPQLLPTLLSFLLSSDFQSTKTFPFLNRS